MSESIFKNKDFVFGLVAGIAVMAVIDLIIVGAFMFSGKRAFLSDGSGSPTPSVANDQAAAPSGPVDVKVTDADHIRGDKNAKITIVEFSDFQCPFCQRFHTTMQQVMGEYKDGVRWVYKHFPLDSIHPHARKAAEAAECAADQGKFWEYADKLMENQASLGDALYGSIASDLGLNKSKFNDCLASGKMAAVVEGDYQQGLAAGVNGTPGNFINGQSVPGAVPFAQIKSIIDSLK